LIYSYKKIYKFGQINKIKTMKKLSVIALSAGMLFLTSCNSDDDNNDPVLPNPTSEASIIETAKSGTWRITEYIDTGNKTERYTGYNFTFEENGTIRAVKGDVVHTGVWSVNDFDNSDDDNNSNDDIDFNIAFSAPADFEDLSDDWDIKEITPNTIRLIDVSGGNDSTDHLTFQRN